MYKGLYDNILIVKIQHITIQGTTRIFFFWSWLKRIDTLALRLYSPASVPPQLLRFFKWLLLAFIFSPVQEYYFLLQKLNKFLKRQDQNVFHERNTFRYRTLFKGDHDEQIKFLKYDILSKSIIHFILQIIHTKESAN